MPVTVIVFIAAIVVVSSYFGDESLTIQLLP